MTTTYAEAGVDQTAKDAAVDAILRMSRRTHDPGVLDIPWGFAGLYALKNSSLFDKSLKNPVLVACTDGVGTKLKIARALNKHDTVGIDLVAMSVNDLIVTGATPLFFLDYIAIAKTDRQVLLDIVKGVVDGCLQSQCALLGGETAEMPGMYAPGDYDLAGFAVGVVDKAKILDGSAVKAGDDVIAVASSGLHSNGFSLARKIVADAGVAYEQTVPELGARAGDALLAPTRIYAKAVKAVLRNYKIKKAVKAMANITGGGIVENVPRVIPKGLAVQMREGSWPVPPVFSWLQKLGGVAESEMRRVFNMGVGFVLVTSPTFTNAIVRTLRRAGEQAFVAGTVVKGAQDVTFVKG
jgi:phosphoribosylformylglycinamidine cyclo-ligase